MRRKIVHSGIKASVIVFVISFIVISLVGAAIGVRGVRVEPTKFPIQDYEEVTFPSDYRDHINLTGWFFPASGPKVAVIVHGWGGHRGRLLSLAEYLQRSGISVLTFDLRGGTGRNSYGQKESGDVKGAVTWLTTSRGYTQNDLSIIGNSMGGAAAIVESARQSPEKLILISPVVDIAATKKKALMERNYIFSSLYASGASWVERTFYGIDPVNPRDVFNDIAASVYIIHGNNDELSPVDSVRDMVTTTTKTNVTAEYLPNAGHRFFYNEEANNFIYSKKISEFITR